MSHRAILGAALLCCLVPLAATAAFPPGHVWSARFGDADDQTVSAVATAADGHVLVCGQNWGTLNLGGAPLVSAGGADLFVAARDAQGAHLWSRGVGAGGDEVPQAIAVDAAGSVYVAGFVDGSPQVDFGGGPLTTAGMFDAFLVKYDANGQHLWSRVWGDGGVQEATAVAVDAAGNVAVTGGFEGTVDFGGGPLTSAGATDVFVASFDATGAHRWSARYGGAQVQLGTALACAPAGDVYVAGQLRGSADFGGGPLASAGLDDVFLARLSPAGAHVWSRRFGSSAMQWAAALAVAPGGDVVLAGNFDGAIDFGGGALTCSSPGAPDVYVARLGADGSHLWSRRAGGPGWQRATSVSVVFDGTALVAGDFDGTLDVGDAVLTNADDGQDIFLAAYTAAGAPAWHLQFADAVGAAGVAAAGPGGSVAVAGDFLGAVDLGGGPLVNVGTWFNDIFIARLHATVDLSAAPPPAVAATGVLGCRPNPFNPSTLVSYRLDRRGPAVLEIADARGQVVARLDLGRQEAGRHEARWDGRDRGGRALPSGIYLCRLAGSAGQAAKLVLVR